ncbi:MAG: ADP-ribosylglycohydrolase family protein [Nitrospinae bacterium]|nr:ADP-ribosylglycohydrolase family protein [Nitrospinota bacterium]
MSVKQLQSRIRGAWYGVFVGDALGTTLEFQPKPDAQPSLMTAHAEIVGGGPFRLEPGDWTDDGAMTLCLAKALAEDTPPEMDAGRQLENYVRWWHEGFCSSNGRCFDIGNQTSAALRHFETSGGSEAPLDEHGQGNGSLMRAVPVPIWLGLRSDTEQEAAGQTDEQFQERAKLYTRASQTTHNSPVCTMASVLYSVLVFQALHGATKEKILILAKGMAEEMARKEKAFSIVVRAIEGGLTWEEIEPTGWAIHSLAVTFWGLNQYSSFENGMIAVVNLCGDADTNGAIYGGLAGAIYGFEQNPGRWVGALKNPDMLEKTLTGLVRGA